MIPGYILEGRLLGIREHRPRQNYHILFIQLLLH